MRETEQEPSPSRAANERTPGTRTRATPSDIDADLKCTTLDDSRWSPRALWTRSMLVEIEIFEMTARRPN